MMTAEQFYVEQNHTYQWTNDFTGTARVGWEFKFAEAYAAAQLAEKEREIARLQLLLDGKQANHGRLHPESPLICFHCGKRVPVAFNQCTDCKEAAEQRLQEAQAWKESQLKVTPDWQKIGELLNVGLGQSVTENIIPAIMDLRERLRQREAELEQRWIAVEERLPDEPQQDVLLWTADDWESSTNFQQIGIIGEFNRNEWDGKVTHWQPLPSPPKEAK